MAKDGLRVFTDTLSIAKCITTLEDAGATGLNGEQITVWFTDTIAVPLYTVLFDKVQDGSTTPLTEAGEAKIATAIQSYLDMFISLASGKTQLIEKQRTQLAKCLELTGADESSLGVRFIARFAKMAQKEQEALDSLGIDLTL